MSESSTIAELSETPEPVEPLRADENQSRDRFSNRRAYAQTLTATALTRGIGVVTGILAARLLGPNGRGELAVIVFLPSVLALIGEIELPRSIAVEASQEPVPAKLVSTSVWLALALGVIQAVILIAVLPLYLPADKLYLSPASRWFMMYLPATYVTAALMGGDQGQGRFGRFSFLMVLPGALYAIFIFAFVLGVRTPARFAACLLAGAAFTAIIRVMMDGGQKPLGLPDPALARKLLVRGANFYLPAIAGFVLSRADLFILIRIVPTEQVGLYVVAQAIALGQMGAVLPFVHVGFAAVAREGESPSALAVLAQHFRLAQIAAIGMALLAVALTPWAIRTLFGPEFSGARIATYLLIGATALWGSSQMLEQGLRAAGHPRVGIVSNLAGLAVLVTAGVPACLSHGIGGIAAAALAAQALNILILIAFCIVRLKMPIRWFWAFSPDSLRELYVAGVETLSQLFREHIRFGQ
jgi:O-antigen/teichoic acid export membrane protein